MDETTVWKGHSSQVLNLKTFLGCALFAVFLFVALAVAAHYAGTVSAFAIGVVLVLLLLPIGVSIWAWLKLRSRVYELTTERFLVTHGIFSRQTDTMELYRVKDLTVLRPLFLRLFGRGNLILQTSDRTTPTFIIEAIPDPKGFSDLVRKNVEACRDRKRVGEIDMNEKVNE